jgi:hypothetical protein
MGISKMQMPAESEVEDVVPRRQAEGYVPDSLSRSMVDDGEGSTSASAALLQDASRPKILGVAEAQATPVNLSDPHSAGYLTVNPALDRLILARA